MLNRMWFYSVPMIVMSYFALLSSDSKADFDLIKEKFRLQTYGEFMSPALSGPHVPDPFGEKLSPAFVDGRVWVDYAITPRYRILLWQRYFIFPFNDYAFYDPRIGFRWMQVFDIPGLSTTYDFYILPGISKMAQDANRFLEIGSRTNTTYSIPNSRWDLGIVTEINASSQRCKQRCDEGKKSLGRYRAFYELQNL